MGPTPTSCRTRWWCYEEGGAWRLYESGPDLLAASVAILLRFCCGPEKSVVRSQQAWIRRGWPGPGPPGRSRVVVESSDPRLIVSANLERPPHETFPSLGPRRPTRPRRLILGRDVEGEVTVPFTFETNGPVATLSGELTLDRLEYDVGEASIILSDEVTVSVEARLRSGS